MSDSQYGTVLDHEYDGIQEYDNPTPGWWHVIFQATTLFAVVYFIFFTFSPMAWTPQDQYDEELAANLRLQFAEIGELEPTTETLVKYMHDAKWLKVGQMVFKQNCTNCHGADGSGVVGPNLTDEYYKHVKKLDDIPRVIANGAANGAMPAWKTRLHPNEIVLVACYVASLRGQDLPSMSNIKGEIIPPWPQPAAGADETGKPPAATQPAGGGGT